jgi:hypothetical protein
MLPRPALAERGRAWLGDDVAAMTWSQASSPRQLTTG